MAEKAPSIEKRIAPQASAEGLDSTHLDQAAAISERVSEHVGEPSGDDGAGDDKKVKKSAHLPTFGDRIGRMLHRVPAAEKPLPEITVQRKEVARVLKRERRKLLRQIDKVQNKKNFSASALEDMVGQLRHIEELLAELLRSAARHVTEMYERIVRKSVF